jgi:hypothetical protein
MKYQNELILNLVSIWLQSEIIEHPMYLDVTSSIFNAITVEIRDDAGKHIKFQNNSKSSLSLHFRQKV